MSSSLGVNAAYKAIAMGFRLPRWKRVSDFQQQCRTIDEIRRREIDVVLDVGANRGFYAKHLRMLGFSGRILSFEPDPETFHRLERMAAGDDRWQTFNCALGEEAGETAFNVIKSGDETVLSSILAPIVHQTYQQIIVPIRTITEVLDRECIGDGSRIFLKMDTQGFDLKVLKGARQFKGIKLLQSEISVIPLYVGMTHYLEALNFYESQGFRLLDLFVVNRNESGEVLEYDALMAS